MTTISKTIFTFNAFIFKNIVFKTRRPNSINHGTNHPLVKEILNYIDKWPGLLQREDNHKNEVGSFKDFLPKENIKPEELRFTWKQFFKSWSLGTSKTHSRENHIYMCLYNLGKISHNDSGERCGFWASCFMLIIVKFTFCRWTYKYLFISCKSKMLHPFFFSKWAQQLWNTMKD